METPGHFYHSPSVDSPKGRVKHNSWCHWEDVFYWFYFYFCSDI